MKQIYCFPPTPQYFGVILFLLEAAIDLCLPTDLSLDRHPYIGTPGQELQCPHFPALNTLIIEDADSTDFYQFFYGSSTSRKRETTKLCSVPGISIKSKFRSPEVRVYQAHHATSPQRIKILISHFPYYSVKICWIETN